jgi:hypothetical protein
MAVVKLTKKDQLDALAAKLTLDLKRKVTQQEILDLCIEYAIDNYEDIAEKLSPGKFDLTKKKVNAIKNLALDFEELRSESIDDDIYN